MVLVEEVVAPGICTNTGYGGMFTVPLSTVTVLPISELLIVVLIVMSASGAYIKFGPVTVPLLIVTVLPAVKISPVTTDPPTILRFAVFEDNDPLILVPLPISNRLVPL